MSLRIITSTRRPLQTLLFSKIVENNTAFLGKRWLFARESLKLPAFEQKTANLEDRMEDIKDKFIGQVNTLIEDGKGTVFLGDLQLLIHLANLKKHKDLVEKFTLRFVEQQTENVSTVPSGPALGANLMRMCHAAKDHEFAYSLLTNEALQNSKIFSLSSIIVCSDLLFEHGLYDTVQKITEDFLMNVDETMDDWPKPGIDFILYATYLKQNTPKSLESLRRMKILPTTYPYSNGPFMGALLALRQNDPELACTILQDSACTNHSLTYSKTLILCWAQAETGALEELAESITVLKKRLSDKKDIPIIQKLMQENVTTLDRDVIDSIKAAVAKQEDEEMKAACLSKISDLESLVVLHPGIIDKALPRMLLLRQQKKKVQDDSDNEPRQRYMERAKVPGLTY